MIYMRASASDYDDWERFGNPGWGSKDLLQLGNKVRLLLSGRLNRDAERPFRLRRLKVFLNHRDMALPGPLRSLLVDIPQTLGPNWFRQS